MATDGKDDVVEGSWSPKRPRTAAVQPVGRPAVATDPDVLAADIERTREELAGTLAAIADRVSPKQVVRRTKLKVGESVKETAGRAEEALRSGAAVAVETVKEAADAVKQTVSGNAEQTGRHEVGQRQPAGHLADEPHVAVPATSERVVPGPNPLSQETVTIPVSSAGALADATPAAAAAPLGADLPSPVRPTGGSGPAYRPAPVSKVPVYAGALAALAVVLVMLRRRRR